MIQIFFPTEIRWAIWCRYDTQPHLSPFNLDISNTVADFQFGMYANQTNSIES